MSTKLGEVHHSSLGYRPPAPEVIVSGNKTKELKDGFVSTH